MPMVRSLSAGVPIAPGAPEGLGQWWQMPQGGMDEGEDPEAAARRELEEETGVTRARFIGRSRQWYSYDLPPNLLGSAWQGRYRGQTQLWFAARFEGEDSEIDLNPKPGHEREFDAWRWVPIAGFPASWCPSSGPFMKASFRRFEPLVLGT